MQYTHVILRLGRGPALKLLIQQLPLDDPEGLEAFPGLVEELQTKCGCGCTCTCPVLPLLAQGSHACCICRYLKAAAWVRVQMQKARQGWLQYDAAQASESSAVT